MSDARTRLRQLGQLDLSAWVEAALGIQLWSIQRRIGAATSKRRARVAVPSCNASGKTFLGARLALAFYDAYTPGTPCAACQGPCRGSKILTTSSKAEHLRDALWAEMRIAYSQLKANGVSLPGVMARGQNLRLEEDPSHFIVGYSPNHAEGFQGFHAAHKLILGDEATSLDAAMQQGITGLLATGDSRLLLIFNPTTDDTYAALEARSPRTEVIKIRAWDTPHFTEEPVPEGANLTQPEWLDELKDKGMGPGCFDPETEILTRRGWLPFPEVRETDECLSRAPDETSAWAPITKVHRYPHKGTMVRLDGRSLDLFVTPGHRFPLVGRGLTSVVDFRAEEALPREASWVGGEARKPVTFEHGGPGTGFAYRRWEFDPGDFAEFLGWYVSEGNVTRSRNRICLAQSPGRPETARIRDLLTSMGVGTAYSGHQFSFGCAPLAAWLDEHAGHGSAHKRIPDWVLGATPDIHGRFLMAYELGDGHTLSGGGAVYVTKSKGLVDDLQSLMGRYGTAGGWSQRPNGNYDVRRLCAPRNAWLRREHFKLVPYDGDVWCISTPYQTFLARRSNRHPFWSGNTYEWTTRVEADFWTQGDDVLISPDNFDRALATPHVEGSRQLGIDLAPYGSDENIIAYRDGNALVRLEAFPAMRQDLLFEGPVADAVRSFNPDFLSWDADGVGAGVYGYVDKIVVSHNAKGGNLTALPFRGGVKVDTKFNNARSAWWWALRRRFEAGTISLSLAPDQKLRTQAIDIRYSVTEAGDIKIETKEKMKRRGTESPDRADGLMYAFALVDEIPVPVKLVDTPVQNLSGVRDRSEQAMWNRDMSNLRRPKSGPTPWDKPQRGQAAWDDI